MGDILTVHDAAKRFGFSTKYIYAKIQAGELKSLRKQGTTFIDSDDLLPSPYDEENSRSVTQEEEDVKPALDEALERFRQQITDLKAENQALQEAYHDEESKTIAGLERQLNEQDDKIRTLDRKAQTERSDQALIEHLQEVVRQQREEIARLQERLEASQQEVIHSIKEANQRKDEQLKQYIEFLNHSTKELISSIEHKDTGAPAQETPISSSSSDHEVVDVEIAKEPVKMKVTTYLKAKGLKKKERKQLEKRFRRASFKDHRRFVSTDEGLYLFPYQYDYDHLLEQTKAKHHKGKD